MTQQGVASAELGRSSVSWAWLRTVACALPLSASERIALLDCYAEERNFLDLTGVSPEGRLALIAATERERRTRGLPAACPDCDAGVRQACTCASQELEGRSPPPPPSAEAPCGECGPGLVGIDAAGERRRAA